MNLFSFSILQCLSGILSQITVIILSTHHLSIYYIYSLTMQVYIFICIYTYINTYIHYIYILSQAFSIQNKMLYFITSMLKGKCGKNNKCNALIFVNRLFFLYCSTSLKRLLEDTESHFSQGTSQWLVLGIFCSVFFLKAILYIYEKCLESYFYKH